MTSQMFGPKTSPTWGPERPFRCLDDVTFPDDDDADDGGGTVLADDVQEISLNLLDP